MDLIQKEPFQALLDFTPFPLWRLSRADEPPGATQVRLFDLRFGLPAEDRFVATAIVAPDRRVLRSWYQFQPEGEFPSLR